MGYGPIELLVLEHDGRDLPPGSIGALADLTASGLVVIVDVAMLVRDSDGSIHARELCDIDPALISGLDPIVEEIAGLISADDLADLGEAVRPGRSALVVVLEHRWPGRLDASVRQAGGAVSLHLRIPRDAVDEVVAARSAVAS
ncbi:MAG TPA: DUF6325 family protein [Candidatus Limnocylindria bacterium]|jgi:uncharacterized membrane protein